MIRAGTAEDAEAVARVQIDSWRVAYAHLFTAKQLGGMSLAERTDFWRRFPPSGVAEVDGEVIGFVHVGNGELYAIYVHPDRWGSGVGGALLEAGEERLRELGYSDVILWVFEDNPRARRFYERAGWHADGERQDAELFGMSGPAVRYAKRL